MGPASGAPWRGARSASASSSVGTPAALAPAWKWTAFSPGLWANGDDFAASSGSGRRWKKPRVRRACSAPGAVAAEPAGIGASSTDRWIGAGAVTTTGRVDGGGRGVASRGAAGTAWSVAGGAISAAGGATLVGTTAGVTIAVVPCGDETAACGCVSGGGVGGVEADGGGAPGSGECGFPVNEAGRRAAVVENPVVTVPAPPSSAMSPPLGRGSLPAGTARARAALAGGTVFLLPCACASSTAFRRAIVARDAAEQRKTCTDR